MGVVTCRRAAEPQADDALMLQRLEGVDVVAAPWDDPAARWAGCDAVLIRSPWDYHERIEEFLAWLEDLEAAAVPVWNPTCLVVWNARKTYLRELEAGGVPTVPTLWLEGTDLTAWRRALGESGWEDLVLKPIVGASSFLTWRMSRAEALERTDRLERLAEHGGALAQPLVEEILALGEWSLMYFEGRFSHAVRKRAAPGEFRVQLEFGGSEEAAAPPEQVEAAARKLLDRLPARPLYARVDGAEVGGRFLLTELELIEPVLFLASADAAPSRFARAVEARLAAHVPR